MDSTSTTRGQAEPPAPQVSQELLARVGVRIEEARKKLVEITLRNRLINTTLEGTRTRSLQIVGESSDGVFAALVGQGAALGFAPSPVRRAQTDAPPPSLLNDEQAHYEAVALPTEANRSAESTLQTKLDKDPLAAKLTSLFYESKEHEEEQGVNVLYLALGFLRWYEDANAEIARYAPLVLVPVDLSRDGARHRYRLQARDEDLMTNLSLKLFLESHYAITLPDLPEEGDWSPGSYLAEVALAVAKEERWEVLTDEQLLGFFSFSKFLLWRDLDPKYWPSGQAPGEQAIVRRLLSSATERCSPNSHPPIVPPHANLDDHYTPHDLVYVLDADSSQTVAIQTALAGRDLTIQGPPGTGKSQTIANLIGAAIGQGKKVLFIAEKMAALEVVKTRLVQAGLGPLCLELHSRKASKTSVHAQLKAALELPNVPAVAAGLLDDLLAQQRLLNTHAVRLNAPLAPWGISPFEALGAICRLHRLGIPAPNFELPDALNYTKETLQLFLTELRELAARLQRSGVPARHPWRAAMALGLTPFTLERLEVITHSAASITERVTHSLQALAAILPLPWPDFELQPPAMLAKLGEVLPVARALPALPLTTLGCFALTRQLPDLRRLLAQLARVRQARAHVDELLIPGWQSHDLRDLRLRYAGSGGSLLSVFSSTWRRSRVELKGLFRSASPLDFAGQIKLLDDALLASSMAHFVGDIAPALLTNLGPLWRGFDTDAHAIAQLLGWLERVPGVVAEDYAFVLSLASSQEAQAHIEQILGWLAELAQFGGQLDTLMGVPAATHAQRPLRTQRQQWQEWRESTQRANDWPPVRDQLAGLAQQLGPQCHEQIWHGHIAPEMLVAQAEIVLYEKLWTAISAELPALAALDGYRLDQCVGKFRELDRERLAVSSQEILRAYLTRRPAGSTGEMGVIRQEMNKKRNLYSVRRLMREAGQAVVSLKPVFLMSPLSVAQFLPPGLVSFDLIIIDEASQVRPEDALGAIARARQIVTVGDDRQLPPTNFFNRLLDDGLETTLEDDEVSLGDIESILSLSNITLADQVMLRWHYRSLHPGLIAVSNHHFYGDKLLLPPSTLRGSFGDGMGVSFVRSPPNGYVRGGSDGGRNVLEAALIAEAVIEFAQRYPAKSLGVAALSVKQRDAIRDLVEEQRRQNPATETFFSSERAEPFFIKNLESIQGDERDVVFISVGYGPDEHGRLTQSFGPLGVAGGERRLNVLISRAKERCTVFSSITAEAVRGGPGKAGINAFREFLQYAEKGYFDVPLETARPFGSDFEESVAQFLQRAGYEVHPQVGMAGFFIDLGILDPDQPERYLCGIECDGATYHSSRSARDRDRLRHDILVSRGWRLYRIWSTDWFHRRPQQEQQLLDALREMREQARAPVAEPASLPAPPDLAQPLPVSAPPALEEPTIWYEEFREQEHSALAPHAWPAAKLRDLVVRIVRLEGPIHEEEVGRRVSRCTGYGRAGARLQTAVRTRLMGARDLHHHGAFWQAQDATVVVRNRARVATPTLNKAANLPPEEIALALQRLVRDSVQIEREELIQRSSRLFGFLRCGPELKEVLGRELDAQLAHGRTLLGDGAGRVRLRGDHDAAEMA